MDRAEAGRRLADAPVGHLGTVDTRVRPHVVPCCFAVDPATGVVYSAVDAKPKTTTALRRLVNIAANPEVMVLVHHYEADWSRLWWVRARGHGRVVEERRERERAVELLRAKYPQYATHALDGPVLAVDVAELDGWAAAAQPQPPSRSRPRAC